MLTPGEQLIWKERGDELNKAMLYLMNSKIEHAQNGLTSGLFSRKHEGLSPNIEKMARYLSTQYPNNNQRNGKRGIQIREMIQNPKTKTVTWVTLQVHTLEILQPLKNPPLLSEGLVLALTFWG